MAKLAQPGDQLCSDEPAATDDYDLHVRQTLGHGASIRYRPHSAVDVSAECLQAGRKTLQRPSIAIGFILVICPRCGDPASIPLTRDRISDPPTPNRSSPVAR